MSYNGNEFDQNLDSKGGFNIKQLVKRENGSYEFREVGEWNGKENQVIMDDTQLQWSQSEVYEYNMEAEEVELLVHGKQIVPISTCSKPCGPGRLYNNFLEQICHRTKIHAHCKNIKSV